MDHLSCVFIRYTDIQDVHWSGGLTEVSAWPHDTPYIWKGKGLDKYFSNFFLNKENINFFCKFSPNTSGQKVSPKAGQGELVDWAV